MSIMEISLLVLGIIVFVASFIIPEKKGSMGEENQLGEEQIKNMIDKQMVETKKRLEGVVDETLEYAVEKTERAAEKISNEKIMAVNEYSDTVLEEINKNHKEVMFLYDMLNDKHKNITNVAIEVDKKAKVVEETAKEAEEKVLEVRKQAETVQEKKTVKTVAMQQNPTMDNIRRRQKVAADNMIELLGAKRIERPADTIKSTTSSIDMNRILEKKVQGTEMAHNIQSIADHPAKTQGRGLESYVATVEHKNGKGKEEKIDLSTVSNNNDRILILHKQGKNNVAIAKELGLGVGEVNLVLNLFKGNKLKNA